MNMETISNTDFDRLEKLLCTKRFVELSVSEKQWVENILAEEEYTSMAALYISLSDHKHGIDIEPQAETKNKLNKALAIKVKRPGVFQLKMPMYQSVAAALIFFLVGFGINLSRPIETKIIHDTVQVIKYIPKTENKNNMASETNKLPKKQAQLKNSAPEPEAFPTLQPVDAVDMPEANPEVIRQQEIAMTNINRVLNEKNGSSLEGDTVLQKMLVTVY